jgi:membrane protein required for colicin V production
MADLPINVVDIAILAVLLLSALLAFVRGCVHEVLSVAAWVGAALATLYGFEHAQPYARDLIAIDLLADIAAGVVIFVVTLILLSIVTRIFSGRVRDSSLGALDRSLGLVFGLARGALIIAAAWMLMTWALPNPDERPSYLREAKSARLAQAGADALERALPASIKGQADAAMDQAKQGAEDARRAKDAYDALSQPQTEAEDPGSDPGYTEESRKEMERLTDTVTDGSDGSGGNGSGGQ